MGNTAQMRLSYIAEASDAYGVHPGTGDLTDFRFTSEGLGQDTNINVSDEIRSDRQTVDVLRTSAQVGGTIAFELSTGQHDDLIEAALLSAGWSTLKTVSQTDISFVLDSSNQYDIVRIAGDWTADYVVNQWVKITGAGEAENNGYAKIVTVTTLTLTVKYNGTGAVESAGASVTVLQGAQVVNGTTLSTFVIEKHFQDEPTANPFTIYLGMAIDTFGINVTADAKVVGNSGWIGKNEASATESGTGANPTYITAQTEEVLETVDHIPSVLEAGLSIGVTEFAWDLANKLRARLQVGVLGPVSLGTGSMDLNGTLRRFFTSTDEIDKYLNNTVTDLVIIVHDSNGEAGKGYIFDFPRVKYTSGRRVAGGKDQDIIAELAWMAYYDPTETITMRVVRFV